MPYVMLLRVHSVSNIISHCLYMLYCYVEKNMDLLERIYGQLGRFRAKSNEENANVFEKKN